MTDFFKRIGSRRSAALMAFAVLLIALDVLIANGIVKGAEAYEWRSDPHRTTDGNPSNWKEILTQMQNLLAYTEEQILLQKIIVKAEEEKKNINVCALSLIQCSKNNKNLIGLTLNGYNDATLTLSAIPDWVKSLTITNSKFTEKFTFAAIPVTVQRIELRNVAFAGSNAKVLTVTGPILGGLIQFICVQCHITGLSFSSSPRALLFLDLSGNDLSKFSLEKLPPTVSEVVLQNCNLSTNYRSMISSMPSTVTTLNLASNGITGTLKDLGSLPPSLQHVVLDDNMISGDVMQLTKGLTQTATSLVSLSVARNQLTGTFSDSDDAFILKSVQLSGNKLNGVDWEKMRSKSLTSINVSHMQLSGPFLFQAVPRGIKHLDISFNSFTGPVDIKLLPPGLEYFDISHNEFSGKIDLTLLPDSIRYVYIQYNKFEGQPNLVELPVEVRRVIVHHNNWDSLLPAL